MDSPLAPPEDDICGLTARSIRLQRPLLHHLNADTSWLLQIPIPSTSASDDRSRRNQPSDRNWYTILIDPWFQGSQIDIASWFSEQWHASQSSVSSIPEIEDLARYVEKLSRADILRDGQSNASKQVDVGPEASHEPSTSPIDLVVISHEFSDHCHKETLLAVNSDIPILATTRAVSLIKSWKHFRHVQEIPLFSGKGADCRERSLSPLPEWLSVSRLVGTYDPLAFHSALMIAFDVHSDTRVDGDNIHLEAVIYSPHGIHAAGLQPVAEADPSIRTLALVHGLHVVELSKVPLNLGAHAGLEAQRILQAKYWVSTHDEKKLAQGLVGSLLSRKVLSFKDAILAEGQRRGLPGENRDSGDCRPLDADFEDASLLELKNGESTVLA